MKTDTIVNISLTALIGVGIYMIINAGRNLLDTGLGDDPAGSVGGTNPKADYGDPDYPGWYTRYFMRETGNPEVDPDPIHEAEDRTMDMGLWSNPAFWVIYGNAWVLDQIF